MYLIPLRQLARVVKLGVFPGMFPKEANRGRRTAAARRDRKDNPKRRFAAYSGVSAHRRMEKCADSSVDPCLATERWPAQVIAWSWLGTGDRLGSESPYAFGERVPVSVADLFTQQDPERNSLGARWFRLD